MASLTSTRKQAALACLRLSASTSSPSAGSTNASSAYRRTFQSAPQRQAQLVDPHTSLLASHAQRPPPDPPRPDPTGRGGTTSAAARSPPPLPTSFHDLASSLFPRTSSNAHPPPPPPVPQPDTSAAAADAAARTPPAQPRDVAPEAPHEALGNSTPTPHLDAFLLRALAHARSVYKDSDAAGASSENGGEALSSVSELATQATELAGEVLQDFSLAYESAPVGARRVDTSTQDAQQEGAQQGIVHVAHVVGGDKPTVSVCTGFVLEASPTAEHAAQGQQEQQMVLTCAHTLEAIAPTLQARLAASGGTHASIPSGSFVIASSGHVFPVHSVASSLPAHDLLLLRLAPDALRDPAYAPSTSTSAPASTAAPSKAPRLKSLPISPYPARVGSKVALCLFESPVGRARKWQEGTVTEYKDPIGRVAETGTYDELFSMSFTALPTPGSSGGALVDTTTGAVVGVVRGAQAAYGDKQQRGFATPAEKVFEMFSLPGFTPASARRADEEQREQQQQQQQQERARSKDNE